MSKLPDNSGLFHIETTKGHMVFHAETNCIKSWRNSSDFPLPKIFTQNCITALQTVTSSKWWSKEITKYGPLKVPSDTEDSMTMICSCSLTRIIAYRGYCTTSIFSQCCASRHKRVSSWWVFCTKGQKGWKRVTEPIFAEGEPWEAWSGPRMLHIAHPQLWSWGDRGHLQALLPHARLWPSYTISTVLGKGKCSPNF